VIPAIRSEVLRLRRRTFHLGLLLFVVIAALGSVIALPHASDEPASGPNPGGALVTLADVAASDGFTSGLHFVGSLLGIVALAYWAISSAQDHSSGLIRLLVQAEPRRWPQRCGGGRGIRTPEGCEPLPAFEAGALGRTMRSLQQPVR
jgi:ABC-2 type transport system permease protein